MALIFFSVFPLSMIWLAILFRQGHGAPVSAEEIVFRISLVMLSFIPSVIAMFWLVPRYLIIVKNKFPNMSKITRVFVIPFFMGQLFAGGVALLFYFVGRV